MPTRHARAWVRHDCFQVELKPGCSMALDLTSRFLLLSCCLVLCAAQTPEMVSHDSQPTFTMRSNLVLVRVVVRDKKGQVNGTLQKEDFQLFDKGKPQGISKFSVEKSGGRKADAPAASQIG